MAWPGRPPSDRSAHLEAAAPARGIRAGIVFVLCVCGWCGALALAGAESYRVATYNLYSYCDEVTGTRTVKTEAARASIRDSIRALRADVLALQEMGGNRPFLELRQALKADGVDYPYGELLLGWDTNIHVALLSKFPITACHRHTNDTYLLMGRRHHLARGILEAQVQIASNYTLTAFVVHLKSRRQAVEADESEMRLQEAQIVREKIDAVLTSNPRANLLVLGDFNDVKDSRPVRTILGRARTALFDTRPAERNGDPAPDPTPDPRRDPFAITWTYFYAREDTYSRIDYILCSPGMRRAWVREDTYVLALPIWGRGSDHRPIVAGFRTADR
jgi:endonuclease/exonuclease/phosphatase family metal-dependent hydrolase